MSENRKEKLTENEIDALLRAVGIIDEPREIITTESDLLIIWEISQKILGGSPLSEEEKKTYQVARKRLISGLLRDSQYSEIPEERHIGETMKKICDACKIYRDGTNGRVYPVHTCEFVISKKYLEKVN